MSKRTTEPSVTPSLLCAKLEPATTPSFMPIWSHRMHRGPSRARNVTVTSARPRPLSRPPPPPAPGHNYCLCHLRPSAASILLTCAQPQLPSLSTACSHNFRPSHLRLSSFRTSARLWKRATIHIKTLLGKQGWRTCNMSTTKAPSHIQAGHCMREVQ